MPITGKFDADFNSFYDAVSKAENSLKSLATTGQTEIPKIDKELADVETSTGQMGSKFEGTMQAIAAGLTAVNIRAFATDVKTAATTFINAFAEEEAAVARLTAALKSTGEASPAVVKAYQDMATQFQATTTESDEAVLAAETVLTTIGKVGPEQMELALKATTNLASRMKIDLSDAANQVAKAVGSGGEQLGKLKTLLGDTVKPGMDTAEMLGLINSKVAGSSAAELETYAGKMENLNNRMGDAEEKVGGFILKGLNPLFEAFGKLPEPVQNTALAFASVGSKLVPLSTSVLMLIPGIQALATAYGITLVGALTTLGTLLLPAGLLIAGIAAVYLAFKHWDKIVDIVMRVYNVIKTYLFDRLKELAAMIKAPITMIADAFQWLGDKVAFHSIIPDMINAIQSDFQKLSSVMVDPTVAAVGEVKGQFDSLVGYASDVRSQLMGFPALMGGAVNPWAAQSRTSIGSYGGPVIPAWQLPFAGAMGGGGGGASPITVNINMTGMLSLDEPQTRTMLEQIINRSIGDALKGQRLL
jgi:hypothetical protein